MVSPKVVGYLDAVHRVRREIDWSVSTSRLAMAMDVTPPTASSMMERSEEQDPVGEVRECDHEGLDHLGDAGGRSGMRSGIVEAAPFDMVTVTVGERHEGVSHPAEVASLHLVTDRSSAESLRGWPDA